ncbi:Potassium/sodium hyperpolarization-activated cyclic nucleotide-gated channel 1 [Triplophysa tibetana]|uniref:Potassium/sodium hyperpolarization-activated cyclic nucleotide-gated channel 1 n=1 Tax=Triplophysa tibetana TaxID=1572043 RepID=A0A5A9NYN0_9TELE|nr:Potassium/sodium hyperpolarization-activated cyclic nucleotide-gated channel 1 [Triplophysa tibetana]
MQVQNEETSVKGSRWIIHPLSRTRYVYLVYMVILTVVNLITIPMDMAFAQDIHGTAHKCWISFNVISDVFFCLDIFVNFRLGFFNEDNQMPIVDPQVIKNDYLRSWFVPDLVAAFPSDVCIVIVENYRIDTGSLMASKFLRIVMFARILSIIRLIRVQKLTRFFRQLERLKCFEPLPRALRERAIAGYKWQQKKRSLGLVQESLKKDVMKAMCPSLTNVCIFASGNVKLIEAFLIKLEYEIFQAGDIIICPEGPADRMFFIEDGRVLEETAFFQKELSCGDFFGGEICLLLGGKQPAKVLALSSCTLFSLSVDKLQELENSFPNVLNDLREVARQHLTDIEQGAAEDDEEDLV